MAALDGDDARARIGEALDTVELTARAKDKVGGYSHGMRQRLGSPARCCATRRLLLLDEPTTGLDPGGMRDMRALVRRLADQGITVLLSSHLMGEVEDLCDRVAIVRTGNVVYEGSLPELLATTAGRYTLRTTDDVRAAALAADRRGIDRRALRRRRADASTADEAAIALSLALGEAGVAIAALVPRTATLEELFFRMTEGEPAELPAERRGGAAMTAHAIEAPIARTRRPASGPSTAGSCAS